MFKTSTSLAWALKQIMNSPNSTNERTLIHHINVLMLANLYSIETCRNSASDIKVLYIRMHVNIYMSVPLRMFAGYNYLFKRFFLTSLFRFKNI